MKNKNELALEILNHTRNSLLVKMPFLSKAIFSFKLQENDTFAFSSNGYTLYFKSDFIVSSFQHNQQVMEHWFLHLLIHFLFHHNIVSEQIDYPCWNLACDIACEYTIKHLNLDFYNPYQEEQDKIFQELENQISFFNAENIYSYYQNKKWDEFQCNELRYYFFVDEHGIWYQDGSKEFDQEINWQKIAHQLKTDLETFNQNKASYLTQSLQNLQRRKVSLREFIRKFTAVKENMKVSQEDIDIILYSYGKSIYDNIALVEPLEYKEEKTIQDLVIVIDTSGSVEGEVVQQFIEYTYDLITEQCDDSSRMNLYLIQADDAIQDVALIQNKKQLDEYITNMQIKGLGQTDFRPAFELVNQMIQEGKIKDLKGLLYFSDGDGIFPKQQQKYPTAFILNQRIYHDVEVPVWAMKLQLTREDFANELYS